MDVKEIIISEFKQTLKRNGVTASRDLLRAAEAPFDLQAVQEAVDNDLNSVINESNFHPAHIRLLRQRAKEHEERLRKLSKQYALSLIQSYRRNNGLTPASILIEQKTLKTSAGRRCDIYPCVQQQNQKQNLRREE